LETARGLGGARGLDHRRFYIFDFHRLSSACKKFEVGRSAHSKKLATHHLFIIPSDRFVKAASSVALFTKDTKLNNRLLTD
jgi:hypothetical protein